MAKPSARKDSETKPEGNPLIPPKDGRCIINTLLPPELLAYIFEIGTYDLEDDHDFPLPGTSDLDVLADLDATYNGDDALSSDSENGWHREDSDEEGEWSTDQEDSDTGEDDDDEEEEEELEFPILVSHVCKHWREVALGNPTLWSVIEFVGQPTLQMNKLFLERARNAPLFISIDCSAAAEGNAHPENEMELSQLETAKKNEVYMALEEFLRLIQPHAWHLRELEVMVSHYLLMQLTLETLGSCSGAPILQTLQLYFYEDSDDDAQFNPPEYREQDFVIFHGDVPRLTRVALWGVHLDWKRSTFLSGLQEIEFAYHALDVRPSYRDFLRILRTSPALRCLSLCESGPAGMPVDWLASMTEDGVNAEDSEMSGESPLSITLPIPDLVLAFLPPDYLAELLKRISVPNVTHLALDFEDDDYTPLLERISTPLASAGETRSVLAGLESLKLSGIPTRGIAVVSKVLSELQNLVALNINFNHVDRLWYKLLHHPEDVEPNHSTARTVYCPRLHSLTVSGLNGSEVRRLVEERINRGYKLKQVYMDEADDLASRDQKWLEENLETFEFFEGSDDEDELVFDVDDDMSDFDDDDFIEEDDEDEEWTDEE
ncbi:hypothetical protein NM688_g6841 [Phlebia brevispora]|uniref:Uncharacterized protein n=1 Tax=Phlebia brevispora TaxID=194682 RepID=A0ACC1SC36_9APHY|nr:hypothetical protein NM688_g6841 [Phlebia brevispora]